VRKAKASSAERLPRGCRKRLRLVRAVLGELAEEPGSLACAARGDGVTVP
jgi:hypothetical protein